jgi:hypothetical protein
VPTPSKFTAETRRGVLKALQYGASRRTAAHSAGIDESTLRRWLEEGESASGTSQKGKFRADVLNAEAHPKARALEIVYRWMEDKPELAWKFLERREGGFEPPVPTAQSVPSGPVVIQLSLSDGAPVALSETVIEVDGVEDETAQRRRQRALQAPSSTA